MVGWRFHLDFLDLKCSSYASHSHVFILGLLVYNTVFSHVRASPVVNCKSVDYPLRYQNCTIHPDGVHDLDCFGKYKSLGKKTCVWKPGNHTSEKTYTLIIQQNSKGKEYCKVYNNITDISEEIVLFQKFNMTVEVFEHSKSTNCTKAVFKAAPKSLLRCGPPYNVSFSRRSGGLVVNVSWPQEDVKAIKIYSVRYKALGSLLWNKPPVTCQNGELCTVENLNSSLVYTVQIQCVTNEKCSQCVWSDAYTVLSELTTQPVIVNLEDTDIAEKKGRRLLSLTWKFSAKEPHDGYYVTVGKVSEEATWERIKTTQPEIRLILSYSAYHLNISAVNNASTSPAVRQIIPQREDELSLAAGKVNVTVHSNTSFTIYWEDNLIKNYVCYSVEWMKKGHKAANKSFYENQNNFRTLSLLPVPLEPFKRYSITLHTRPDKDTCNMKHINNSESTYGSTKFYFIEGSPVSAPKNISWYNVTLNSVVLQWSSIPEEDIRGFLLGYTIHYTDHHGGRASTERNIRVDPGLNSYELAKLESGTAYKVQVSGFTQAGAGVRSTASVFTTNYQGFSNLSSFIIVFAVVITVLIFGSPIIKRAKGILWPSIPNPGKSNAMQRIEEPCELELLESINTLTVEERDTNSLQIVKKQDESPASTLPSILPLLQTSEDEEDSAELTFYQRDSQDAAGADLPYITAEAFTDIQQTDHQTPPVAFTTGYTTMEMFQQVNQPTNTPVSQENKPEETDFTAAKSGSDYVRQFSTSPTSDNEDMGTIL